MTDDELLGKYCVARACILKREEGRAFCRQHWAMLPDYLQRDVILRLGAVIARRGGHGQRGRLGTALAVAREHIDAVEREADVAQRRARR